MRRFRSSTPAGFWKPKVVDGLLLNMQPGRPPTNNDLPREVKAAAGATADEIVQRLQTAARQLGCKAPPALPDDPAALGLPGPSAGSGRAYAPPERRLGRLEALPWPQELASGRRKVAESPLVTRTRHHLARVVGLLPGHRPHALAAGG